MTEHPHEWLRDQHEAAVLLEAYARLESALAAERGSAKPAAPAAVSEEESAESDEGGDGDSWVARITRLPEVDPATMPALHGRLIALGLLRFELFGRTGGMRYRLSPLGRRALNAPPPVVVENDSLELETSEEELEEVALV